MEYSEDRFIIVARQASSLAPRGAVSAEYVVGYVNRKLRETTIGLQSDFPRDHPLTILGRASETLSEARELIKYCNGMHRFSMGNKLFGQINTAYHAATDMAFRVHVYDIELADELLASAVTLRLIACKYRRSDIQHPLFYALLEKIRRLCISDRSAYYRLADLCSVDCSVDP